MTDKDLVLDAFKNRNPPLSGAHEVVEKWWAPLRLQGMPTPWYMMLCYLIARDSLAPKAEWVDCKASVVAQVTKVQKGYQSVILRKLAEMGLVKRKNGSDDLRTRLVKVNYGEIAKRMGLAREQDAA